MKTVEMAIIFGENPSLNKFDYSTNASISSCGIDEWLLLCFCFFVCLVFVKKLIMIGQSNIVGHLLALSTLKLAIENSRSKMKQGTRPTLIKLKRVIIHTKTIIEMWMEFSRNVWRHSRVVSPWLLSVRTIHLLSRYQEFAIKD